VALDAAETLAQFMADGAPDPSRFASSIGEIVARLTRGGRRLHAFGEMVALLWADGNKAGAIRLEELWNDLAKAHRFALMCGYTMGAVAGSSNDESFGSVCTCHTRVLPAEGYAALTGGEARLREIARLQQKARSLEAEIAHRAQVEHALSLRERELADFFDNATEGIHRVGPDGTILWANKAELDLLGYAAHEYIGRPIAHFHADKDVIADMLKRLLAGGSLINEPARMLRKDGSIRHVLVNSNGYFEGGKLVYTRCFTRDVTERVLAEQERTRLAVAELEASRAEARRRAFFLNAISHDLRTPLNGLVLQANLARLSAETGDSATLAETLTQIESSVAATSDLLNALLEAARSGGPAECATVEAFVLDEMVSRALSACRAAAEQKGLSLRGVVPDGLRVSTDRVKFERVLRNLLDNAVKFTATGSVHVEAQRTGNDVAVQVVDTGVGIAADEQARLFEEFYQVNNPERDRRKGFGLGLAVAHRLAAELGGSLTLDSEPGRGSRFTLTLPGVAREE
jgi:PAS domain S-box-containing protein